MRRGVYKATLKGKAEWALSFTITLPSWSDYANGTAAEKARWDTYVEKVRAHEQGHVDVAKKAFKDANPKTDFEGKGEACTAAAAIDAAKADLEAKVQAEFDRLVAAVAAASEAYDEESDHGRADPPKGHGARL